MDIHEKIVKKAYELWEQSGRIPGHDLENWLEAERIVKAKGKEEKGPEQKGANKNKAESSGSRKNKSRGLRKERG
jgi:hypothetical protein